MKNAYKNVICFESAFFPNKIEKKSEKFYLGKIINNVAERLQKCYLSWKRVLSKTGGQKSCRW